MAHDLRANSISELIYRACSLLQAKGARGASRAGLCREVLNVNLELRDPRRRHLSLIGRRGNIYAAMAECLWVMAGQDLLDPVMNFFLPRAINYSDDGRVWHDAYGPRVFHPGIGGSQIDNVIETFVLEGWYTRRAVISLWDQSRDTIAAFRMRRHTAVRKAVPCNNMIYFYIRDNELGQPCLHCHVVQRSVDIMWGLSHVNIMEWTLLQELMLQELRVALDDGRELRLGRYYHTCIGLHAYDSTYAQAEAILASHKGTPKEDVVVDSIPLGGATLLSDRHFFLEIYRTLEERIVQPTVDVTKAGFTLISDLFAQYGVPIEHNTLFQYVLLATMYIDMKRYGRIDVVSTLDHYVCEDIRLALDRCTFTPKEWKR